MTDEVRPAAAWTEVAAVSGEEAVFSGLVDVIAPSYEGLPAASTIGVHRHLVSCLEAAQPGLSQMVVLLLNMYARIERRDATFVSLSPQERDHVLRNLAEEDDEQIRDAVDAVLVFTYSGYFSEWSGFDPATGAVIRPAVWNRMGYRGPSLGHPVGVHSGD